MSAADLLRITMECAVPIAVNEMKRIPWSAVERRLAPAGARLYPHESEPRRLRTHAELIAEKADCLLFGGDDPASRRDMQPALRALTEGLAALSFMPGGVRFLGAQFVNEHPDLREVQTMKFGDILRLRNVRNYGTDGKSYVEYRCAPEDGEHEKPEDRAVFVALYLGLHPLVLDQEQAKRVPVDVEGVLAELGFMPIEDAVAAGADPAKLKFEIVDPRAEVGR